MDSELTKAMHYRDQAVHMRKLAGNEPDETARNSLVELSEMYDRLCLKCLDKARSLNLPGP